MKPLTEFSGIHNPDIENDFSSVTVKDLSNLQQHTPRIHSAWFSYDLYSFMDQLQCKHDVAVTHTDFSSLYHPNS